MIIKSWPRTQCYISHSLSLPDFRLMDSGCEPEDESTQLGKHMTPFCPLLSELCSWHILVPPNDRKKDIRIILTLNNALIMCN